MRVGRPRKHSTALAALGDVVRERRLAAGLTRAALAARAGLSENTLMKVEQGQTRDPGVLKVAAMCRALSVSIDDLIEEAQSHHLPQENRPMTHGIVSVGYEGRTIESFITGLQRAGVGTVADVRLNAVSRKAGFSKTRLREALAGVGIDYVHLRSLGNAKENRQPFRDGRLEEGRRAFGETLQAPAAQASLDHLSGLAQGQVVAVLCFESDGDKCHRKVIIDRLVNVAPLPVSALPG